MMGYLRTFFLLTLFTALFIGVGYAVAIYAGWDPNVTMAVFLGLGLALNLFMFLFSDRLVLRMYRAKLVEPHEAPRLHGIIDRLVLAARMPKPAVAIIPSRNPNAFATGRGPKKAVVACTVGIMDLLDDQELEGVLAHELSHVKNRDMLIMTVAAMLASAISFAAYLFLFSRNRGGNPLLGLLLFLTAPLAAALLKLAISRGREFEADRSGAKLCNRPLALASALEKLERGVDAMPLQGGNPATSGLFIVNPFRGRSLAGLFSTHPPTHERVRRLRELT